MTSPMIEHVARAIEAELGGAISLGQTKSALVARAAIEAMRAPTEHIRDEVMSTLRVCVSCDIHGFTEFDGDAAEAVIGAMIDAALEDI